MPENNDLANGDTFDDPVGGGGGQGGDGRPKKETVGDDFRSGDDTPLAPEPKERPEPNPHHRVEGDEFSNSGPTDFRADPSADEIERSIETDFTKGPGDGTT